MKTEMFRIQNQMKSGAARIAACFCQSRDESQPSSTQYPCRLGAPRKMLVLPGGHIHRRIGTPISTAGMKKASHWRRHESSAQKKDRATTVPYACTWKMGVSPATTPAK